VAQHHGLKDRIPLLWAHCFVNHLRKCVGEEPLQFGAWGYMMGWGFVMEWDFIMGQRFIMDWRFIMGRRFVAAWYLATGQGLPGQFNRNREPRR
jgi:hypothetical protein